MERMITTILALTFSHLLPTIYTNQPSFVVPKTNTYHINLVWSFSNATEYSLFVSTNGVSPHRYIRSLTNSATVSNLYPKTSYSFELWALNNGNSLGYYSLVWPWPQTNFYSIYLGTNLVLIETNAVAVSNRFYRASLSISTNLLNATIQSSVDLQQWQNYLAIIVLTNKVENRKLSIRCTNNIDGIMKKD